MFEGSGGWRGVGETGDLILEWNSGVLVMEVDRAGEGGRCEGGQCENPDIGLSVQTHMGRMGRGWKENKRLRKWDVIADDSRGFDTMLRGGQESGRRGHQSCSSWMGVKITSSEECL